MPKVEYHHYIPRFLLRNYRINKLPNNTRRKKKQKGRPAQVAQSIPDKDLKDGLVRGLDLETKELIEVRLSNVFGMDNITFLPDRFGDLNYTSLSPARRDDIEQRLSKLESRAGAIIAGIRNDFEAARPSTTLKRPDEDVLRKFLFIMHYRNKGFHSRFTKSKDEYDYDDRAFMLDFMEKEAIDTPIDVWFRNIRAILDADIQQYPEWETDATKLAQDFHAYELDMKWYLKNLQMHHLVFVQPQSPGLEFVLTENAFSIFEGPNSAHAWTDYHLFSPVSPKLLILSRSILLGTGYEEDTERLQTMRRLTTIPHFDPEKAYKSVFDSLPVHQANNNYSRIIDGKRVPLPTRIREEKHEFYLPFFKISDRNVGYVNSIFLENAYLTRTIIYREPRALQSALDFYLGLDSRGFKLVLNEVNKFLPKEMILEEHRLTGHAMSLEYLETLKIIAHRLGSSVSLKHLPLADYHFGGLPALDDQTKCRYERLGGNDSQWRYDWLQAKQIVRLWIKIDVLMSRKSKEHKTYIRQTRQDFIATNIVFRRIWLMLKNLKELSRSDPKVFVDFLGTGLDITGIEDTLADVRHVFEMDALGRLMLRASQMEDMFKRKSKQMPESTSSSNPGAQVQQMMEMVGSAFVCARAAAPYAEHHVLPRFLQEHPDHRLLLTRSQNKELLIREGVANSFAELELNLTPQQRKRLFNALFKVCYPLEIDVGAELE
ncbi:MAG: hypothetical protein Q9162_005129 [Coniocarpon cinnabarinum]